MLYWQAIRNEFYNRYAKDYEFAYTNLRFYPADTPETSEKKQRRSYSFSIEGNHYLTQREADCIYHMILGLTIKETAYELLLSPRTVEFYLKRIKERFQQPNKKQLLHHIANTPFYTDFMASLHNEFND
ncbi:helix-turn-helix transcriptional regulator [Candidatus Synchoanobacter obligatus]|uniref:LuxR family transcriptional regulator n=1 Tax=Candidatus Synchoanobacter obligatus TaxID=2919597 RepID=A0ABT1L553_9GAMM|nr:LuxR family transcriptional regulator [Candidatus Synchoanobacter obligatus]MCP8352301.1 LuxR family transcriptional regulator [Candidatus Synchoanobacter obligatus]